MTLFTTLKLNKRLNRSAHFGSTYTKIGIIQRRLAWSLSKDDMQVHEAFHIVSTVLAEQTHRSMEQNRQPRNKPMSIWQINI